MDSVRSLLPTLPSLLVEKSTPASARGSQTQRASNILIHRDLSWLQFNDRVLGEAWDESNPLFERVKFLSISSSNLDEFFMIRLASLMRPSNSDRLVEIRTAVLDASYYFSEKQTETLHLLSEKLLHEKIAVTKDENPLGKALFEEQILPQLGAPEVFGMAKISQLENVQLAAIFSGEYWFRIPKTISALFHAKEEETGIIRVFFLDHLLLQYLGPAYGLKQTPTLLRLTRDADFSSEYDEDPESIPDVVRTRVGTREKGKPVRLQYLGETHEAFLTQCAAALKLEESQIIKNTGSLCLHGLWNMINKVSQEVPHRAELNYPLFRSMIPLPFQSTNNIFNALKERDFLLHHPYDSFDAFVKLIEAACSDPDVTMIEQTVYRMDAYSPIIEALKSATPKKRVRVVIELRARFDELNNLRLADELRKAGVEVAFGFGKLKIHAKIALITRKEGAEEKLYTHLSTGNYNANTARQYTDLAILTANQEMGQDARSFFDSVWKRDIPSNFKQLIPAPGKLHRKLLSLIEEEVKAAKEGKAARIFAKVNALVDEVVIESLYAASNAGVQVDLVVRGACSLLPGVKGLSENIRVISIVDRFLEHSRIYYFANSQSIYLSSADWMPRNFFSRIEIAFPVLDKKLYKYIEETVIPTYLSDTVKVRELTAKGFWKKRVPNLGEENSKQIRAQFKFEELALHEYKGTPLE